MGEPLDIQTTATLGGLDVDLRGCGPLPRRCRGSRRRGGGVRPCTAVAAWRRADRAPAAGDRFRRRSGGPAAGRFPAGDRRGRGDARPPCGRGSAGRRPRRRSVCGAGAFALRLAATPRRLRRRQRRRRHRGFAPRRARRGSRRRCATCSTAAARAGAVALRRGAVRSAARRGGGAEPRDRGQRLGRVVAVSCNAESFARDARILQDAGFACAGVTPIDQFRYSAHVEIFAEFRRAKRKRRKGVLG